MTALKPMVIERYGFAFAGEIVSTVTFPTRGMAYDHDRAEQKRICRKKFEIVPVRVTIEPIVEKLGGRTDG